MKTNAGATYQKSLVIFPSILHVFLMSTMQIIPMVLLNSRDVKLSVYSSFGMLRCCCGQSDAIFFFLNREITQKLNLRFKMMLKSNLRTS